MNKEEIIFTIIIAIFAIYGFTELILDSLK